MLRLPPANLADRRDDLRRDETVAANVVPRHLSHDPDQTGNLQHRTRPASRCEAEHGLDGQTQAQTSHDGARRVQTTDWTGRDRRRLYGWRAYRRQARA